MAISPHEHQYDMCLYPIKMRNKRFLPNKKNGGNPPPVIPELAMIEVPCGICHDCRKSKRSGWMIRINTEVRTNAKRAMFVVFTFNEDELEKLGKEVEHENDSEEVAKLAIKRWRERRRAAGMKPIKYWAATELGHEGTERLHLHAIVFGDQRDLDKWTYGNVFVGNTVSECSVAYVTKYFLKGDEKNPDYRPRILVSNGLGSEYVTIAGNTHMWAGENTSTKFRTNKGQKLELPIYLKKKVFTEEQLIALAIYNARSEVRWVCGVKTARDDVSMHRRLREDRINELKAIGITAKGILEKKARKSKRMYESVEEGEHRNKLWEWRVS